MMAFASRARRGARAIVRRLVAVGPRQRDMAGLSAAVVVWVAALVLVAVAGQAVVVQRAGQSVPGPVVARPPSPPSSAPTPTPTVPVLGSFPTTAITSPLFTSPSLTKPPAPFDLGVSDPLKSAPAKASLLPALPAIKLPPLPPELAPLLAVAAPSVREVCTATGVAVVLAGLVKADVEPYGIPVTQALTYLGPVLAVCGLFPATEPSICSVDTALNNALIPASLQILVGIPALAALGVDQVASVEALLRSTGLPLPTSISATLAKSLGCKHK